MNINLQLKKKKNQTTQRRISFCFFYHDSLYDRSGDDEFPNTEIINLLRFFFFVVFRT